MRVLTKDILIRNELKYQIETKQLIEGEKLPSERDLATLFNVQRLTVRNGLQILLQEGEIVRKDRSGYYVAPRRIAKDVYTLTSTSESMKNMGRDLSIELLELTKKSVDKAFSQKMKLPIGTEYYYVVRLRKMGDEVLSVDRSALPCDRVPNFIDHYKEGISLFKLLEDFYQIELDYSSQEIKYEKSDKITSKLLQVPLNTGLVRQEGLVYTVDNEPIEYSESLMPMERYVYIGKLRIHK